MAKLPILFLIFNRPDLTQKTFEKIKWYKPKRLYIAADGPRKEREGETNLCKETREVTNKIDWDCEVQTLFRDENLGCKNAVSQGITWFFENEEMGIILEDDIYVDNSFFQFCEELLVKYKDEDKISMISGCNFSFGKMKIKESYYFSRYSHVWGWASWKRAWRDYDVNLSKIERNDLASQLKVFRFSNQEQKFWLSTFDAMKNNTIDTWDYQWVFTNFSKNRLSIMPSVNLIENLGFRKDATHTHEPGPFFKLKAYSVSFPLVHPKGIKNNYKLDQFSRNMFIGSQNSKLKSLIKNLLHKII